MQAESKKIPLNGHLIYKAFIIKTAIRHAKLRSDDQEQLSYGQTESSIFQRSNASLILILIMYDFLFLQEHSDE